MNRRAFIRSAVGAAVAGPALVAAAKALPATEPTRFYQLDWPFPKVFVGNAEQLLQRLKQHVARRWARGPRDFARPIEMVPMTFKKYLRAPVNDALGADHVPGYTQVFYAGIPVVLGDRDSFLDP